MCEIWVKIYVVTIGKNSFKVEKHMHFIGAFQK